MIANIIGNVVGRGRGAAAVDGAPSGLTLSNLSTTSKKLDWIIGAVIKIYYE